MRERQATLLDLETIQDLYRDSSFIPCNSEDSLG